MKERILKFIREMFTAQSGVSSKRVAGFIGLLSAIMVLFYCTVKGVQAPVMIDMFLICVLTLLGIDSVTNIWKFKK